jgi:hypothetical protein
MLFVSILLSIWFVLWLIFAVFVKDTGKIIVSWLNDMYEEETEENIDPLLEKSENETVYHLSCKQCNHVWWSVEPAVNFCPKCGKPFTKE